MTAAPSHRSARGQTPAGRAAPAPTQRGTATAVATAVATAAATMAKTAAASRRPPRSSAATRTRASTTTAPGPRRRCGPRLPLSAMGAPALLCRRHVLRDAAGDAGRAARGAAAAEEARLHGGAAAGRTQRRPDLRKQPSRSFPGTFPPCRRERRSPRRPRPRLRLGGAGEAQVARRRARLRKVRRRAARCPRCGTQIPDLPRSPQISPDLEAPERRPVCSNSRSRRHACTRCVEYTARHTALALTPVCWRRRLVTGRPLEAALGNDTRRCRSPSRLAAVEAATPLEHAVW